MCRKINNLRSDSRKWQFKLFLLQIFGEKYIKGNLCASFFRKHNFVSGDKSGKNSGTFNFKKFRIAQDLCAMKVGTDGVLLGAWADIQEASTALDIGTGTGLIAIMLTQRNPELTVHAVEIDINASAQAVENMRESPFSERLTVFSSSIQDFAAASNNKYDLIVSNPPFFSGSLLSENERKNKARHTTDLTHNDLLDAVQKLMTRDGKFCLILPAPEGDKFIQSGQKFGLNCSKCIQVRSKAEKSVERLLLQFEFTEKADSERKTLIILEGKGRHDYTKEYTELVKDFYTII